MITTPRLLALATAILVLSPATSPGQSVFRAVGPVSSTSVDGPEPPRPLPGLDSALSDLVRSHDDADLSAELSAADRRVQVEIHLREANRAGVRAALREFVEVTKEHSSGAVLQGWIELGDLPALAAIDGVEHVRRPAHARALGRPGTGPARSEGSDFFAVEEWHAADFRGGEVTVGIIDIGFLGYQDLLGSELPAEVSARNFVDGDAPTDLGDLFVHGTAVAEIIHDVAPDAALALARIDTPADFFDAVEWLVEEQHVDIISTSIGYINGTPGDGTGFFADVVRSAVDRGVFWATAAGNAAESHWGGAFRDFDGDNRHDFPIGDINFGGPGNDEAFFINPDFTFWVFVRWDDWTDVDQDYDLFLYRHDGQQWRMQSAIGGRDRQNGRDGQTPTEVASVRTGGDPAPYGFQVRRIRGDRAANLEIFALLEISETESADVPLHDRLAMRSLPSLADSPAAMTVGAVEAVQPFVKEEFSSEGPANGPGGTAGGGIIKPDIAAYDGVSTTSYGERAFFGTSAATPHVAGAAALVLSAHPLWTPAQLRRFLENGADDLGAPGKDNRFGHGRLELGPPPIPTATHTRVPTPTITHTPTITRTPTITPTPSNTPTPGPCYGDCDGDGVVEINEIITGVRINLGFDSVSRCDAHDHDSGGRVSVSELIRAVRAALFRCVGAV